MIALQIEDTKLFTRKLFLETDLDDLLLKEAEVVTFNRFTIDGHIRRSFYQKEELEQKNIGEFSSWKMLRPFCFSLIKGKKLPESFQIVFMAEPERVAAFLGRRQIASITQEQIQGLYLHIRYEEGRLSCVTGTSLAVFTLDKTVETEWDGYVGRLLKEMGVAAAPY